MKLGIMQPYFFPYIGYFSLIRHTEKWIIFDVVQFMRHGWIERNRILKPGEGWQYISVPLKKHSRNTLIKDIQIRNDEDWRGKLISQLGHYKKGAPFYAQTINIVKESLSIETDSIVELNEHILKILCGYLKIPFVSQIFSKMNLNIEPVTHPGEWALNISSAYRATEYINPPGGEEIFEKKQFIDAGIKLSFLKNNVSPYKQNRKEFESGLSIIDVLMFNNEEMVLTLLDDINIIQHE